MRALIVLFLIAFAMPARVYAQSSDVPTLIKLVENQPNDMDRSTWKEKRRDAARKLAQSKDKRAVPVLMNLADTETFDIIGDIAIEGLGALKDASAAPVLQKIVGDVSRDKSSRDLARKALAKLGAPETAAAGSGAGSGSAAPPPVKTPPTTSTGTGTGSASATPTVTMTATVTPITTPVVKPTSTSSSGGAKSSGSTKASGSAEVASGLETGDSASNAATGLETGGTTTSSASNGSQPTSDVGNQPDVPDDIIAASDRLTFAAGTAGLSYDSASKRWDFDANASGRYEKRIEAESRAFGIDVGADLVTGVTNPDGRGVTKGLVLNVHGAGEARFYTGNLYGIGKTAIAAGVQKISYRDPNNPGNDVVGTAGRTYTADVELALGGGYGRVVDVGSAIRVARLGRALDNARALGKPIDAATSKKLQLAWWALRGERSSFRAMMATVAILREAGILLGEPNAALSYEILQVLQDSQLYMRPSGFDAQLVFGEGYLYRPDADNDGTCDLGASRCGRVEQVIASAGYGTQLDEDKLELSGNAYARYRLFPGDNEPAPWAIGASARMRRFTYGEHGEAFGALDLKGGISLSADDNQQNPCTGNTVGCDTSMRIEGELGFTYWLNQASGLRLSANVAEDAGVFFLGARLEATYGVLDGLFAR